MGARHPLWRPIPGGNDEQLSRERYERAQARTAAEQTRAGKPRITLGATDCGPCVQAKRIADAAAAANGQATVGLSWAVGLTAVPERRKTTVPLAIKSLEAAGFVPRIFVDGDKDPVSWESEFRRPVSVRWPRIGAAGAWWLALQELWARFPLAERYVIFQDDILACRNLKRYLELRPWPGPGYCSLFTGPSGDNSSRKADQVPRPSPGFTGWLKSNQQGRGAQGLLFSREAAYRLLSHWWWPGKLSGVDKDGNLIQRATRDIDAGVIEAFNHIVRDDKRTRWGGEWVHYPSLLQHQGAPSAIGTKWGDVQAPTFPGEGYDALTLLKEG